MRGSAYYTGAAVHVKPICRPPGAAGRPWKSRPPAARPLIRGTPVITLRRRGRIAGPGPLSTEALVPQTDTRATDVVTVFLVHDGRILVLRRSDEVGTYPGRWAGVSGYLESAPLDQAFTELGEELGLGRDDVELLKEGAPLHVRDEEIGRMWRVHPFLFSVKDETRLRLDWEHVQRRWVWPGEIDQLDTVPGLADALHRVYP